LVDVFALHFFPAYAHFAVISYGEYYIEMYFVSRVLGWLRCFLCRYRIL